MLKRYQANKITFLLYMMEKGKLINLVKLLKLLNNILKMLIHCLFSLNFKVYHLNNSICMYMYNGVRWISIFLHLTFHCNATIK